MSESKEVIIFLVDDDALYLKNLQLQFTESTDFTIHTFPTGEKCLENLHLKPNIVVLDYNLSGVDKNAINGIQTLDRIKGISPFINVVMLSEQDKIEIAVDCMHHHAFDYVVKSETAFVRLQKTIAGILQFDKMRKELNWYMNKM
jgi:two-component system OmpR family response regulator